LGFTRFAPCDTVRGPASGLVISTSTDAMSPKLTPNRAKIIEAILYLIRCGEAEGMILTQYDIVKSMFIADDNHLKAWGRPVSFDNYVAMKHGPVPRATYDILNSTSELLWDRIPVPHVSPKAIRFTNIRRDPDESRLSRSDRDELLAALRTVKALKFGGVRDFTHRHAAYRNAWSDSGARNAYPILYIDMIPEGDAQLLDEIVHASRYQ
jgi:uncharacterized phage-associated protein